MTMQLSLTPTEQRIARDAAERRFARAANCEHRWNRDPDDHNLAVELDALAAEVAVARAINREWRYVDGPDPQGDVGDGVQVRHTRYPAGHLLLHPSDADEHFYFLVTGRFPTFTVVGYTRGRWAKQTMWWRELTPGRPCYAVPQWALMRVAQDRR